jgi:TATA-binding protein-associated factor
LIVTSYSTLRQDADALTGAPPAPAPAPSASASAAAASPALPRPSAQPFLYLVLDEGHVLRNAASALSRCVRSLAPRAAHRLLLSGTPVQNAVGDVWPLFDALMPGYLGSAPAFAARFARPLARARAPAASAAEHEAARAALAALHRATLPLILRRLKSEVLRELPPKTLRDVLVDLAPAQRALYAAIAGSPAARSVHADLAGAAAAAAAASGGDGGGGGAAAVPPATLAVINLLRQACNDARLVSAEALERLGVPAAAAAAAAAAPRGGGDFAASAKLRALAELLAELGLAPPPDGGGGGAAAAAAAAAAAPAAAAGGGGAAPASPPAPAAARDVGGDGDGSPRHKALIFVQAASTLRLLESFLARTLPRGSAAVVLHGGLPLAARAAATARFAADASAAVLLSTTAVGGLGLNLTAADTVIFFDSDWNPWNDAQAMDRAHRIGQRRAVAVFRLLARGTVEERVLALQRWKLALAASLVAVDPALRPGAGAGETAAAAAAPPPPPPPPPAALLQLLAEALPADADAAGGGGGGGGGDDDGDDDDDAGEAFDAFKRRLRA